MPAELALCTNLASLLLKNNPTLESPPPHVVDSGLQACLVFLQVRVHVWDVTCTYVCVRARVSVCVCICMYVCMSIYTYLSTYVRQCLHVCNDDTLKIVNPTLLHKSQELLHSRKADTLNLDKYQFHRVPINLAEYAHVTEISMCENDMLVLPEQLCDLTTLQKLDVRQNRLQVRQKQLHVTPKRRAATPHLKKTCLTHCTLEPLQHFPEALGAMLALRTLHADDNQVPHKSAEQLKCALP